MIASAVKTPKGYKPLIKGNLYGSDRTGPQKTTRLYGHYASREWAVDAARKQIETWEAQRAAPWPLPAKPTGAEESQ